MKSEKKQTKKLFPYTAVIAFLVLAFLFIWFRIPISTCNTVLLKVSGELKEVKKRERSTYSNSRKTTRRKAAPKKKPSNLQMFKKPVVRNLSKTPTVNIALLDHEPIRDELRRLPAFPELRKHTGDKWTKEKSEIHMGVYNNKLYALFLFYDKNPKNIVTKNSDKSGGKVAFKDDSVEFFLMKDKFAKTYCQYLCSASGKGWLYYNDADSTIPNRYSKSKDKKNIKMPLIEAERFDDGFAIFMEIDLSNIDISDIGQGDSFLVQIVRNYRGQGSPNSEVLHLFPTSIYADKRMGINNHDRRAFQPVKIQKIK